MVGRDVEDRGERRKANDMKPSVKKILHVSRRRVSQREAHGSVPPPTSATHTAGHSGRINEKLAVHWAKAS